MVNVAEKVMFAIVIVFAIIGLCLIGIAIKEFKDISNSQSQQSNLPDVSDYNKKVTDNSIVVLCLGGAGSLFLVISIWAWFKRE